MYACQNGEVSRGSTTPTSPVPACPPPPPHPATSPAATAPATASLPALAQGRGRARGGPPGRDRRGPDSGRRVPFPGAAGGGRLVVSGAMRDHTPC
ncbi:hypothetical protein GCM10027168_17770 [Streptomyces capparidis]